MDRVCCCCYWNIVWDEKYNQINLSFEDWEEGKWLKIFGKKSIWALLIHNWAILWGAMISWKTLIRDYFRMIIKIELFNNLLKILLNENSAIILNFHQSLKKSINYLTINFNIFIIDLNSSLWINENPQKSCSDLCQMSINPKAVIDDKMRATKKIFH